MTKPAPPKTRYWLHVDKNGPVIYPDLGPCWIWTGGRFVSGGYGAFNFGGGWIVRAHRVAFYWAKGYWPYLHLLHKCDNPPCVNPAHLIEGTDADNNADMRSKDRHARGERVPNARLTAETVVAIRDSFKKGSDYASLAREYGVSTTTISDAVRRRTWKHVK